MKQQFGLKDIKSGYVVKVRDGDLYMAMRYGQNHFFKIFINQQGNGFNGLNFNSDLTFLKESKSILDIVEVYGLNDDAYHALWISTDGRPLLWKRIEEVEMTMDEICKELGKQVKIVEKH